MKQLLFTAIGFGLAFYSCAQTTAIFRIKNLPGHRYIAYSKMTLNTVTNYDGDPATLKQFKASGIQFPLVMGFETNINSHLKTSQPGKASELPFVVDLKQSQPKFTVSGKLTPVPDKASDYIVNGKFNADGKIGIQGVQGKRLTDSLKYAVMSLVKNIAPDIEFPKPALKPGDSFAQEEDMDVPIPGFYAKMTLTTTFKLVSIVNGKGIFNTTFVATMNANTVKDGSIMNGTGTGKMVFDIAGNHVESIYQNIKMTFVRPMPNQGVSMKGTAQMLVDQHVTMK